MHVFTRWDEKSSKGATDEILQKLALIHASRISEKTSRERLTSSLTNGDFPDLCDLDPSYETLSVNDAMEFRQVTALFSKRADLDIPGVNRREVAIRKFIEAEQLCRETNTILRYEREGKFNFLPHVAARIYLATQKIARILGPVPTLADLKPRFGPGATTQVKKRSASARRKLGQTHACSEDLLPIVRDCLEEMQGWVFSHEDTPGDVLSPGPDSVSVPVEIHTGKLNFVPKSAKTDRAIVVEPSLNSMFQMAIGDYMAVRLRRFGVDIRDQSRNQRLAREGSLSGALATLDLSSASDTIAYELIYALLPIDWALFLSHFRSGKIEYKGITISQEKFSSMGNGFTFPLETLIFYGLATSCSASEDLDSVSVYGDDIIVPTTAYECLVELLNALGFIPNVKKSFSTGPFRESCGADYLSGIDIRPSYVKDALSAFDIFRLHNQYVRRKDYECAAILLNTLDPPLRKWGPDGYGDGHLVTDDFHVKPFKRGLGWSGGTFETYTFQPRKDFSVLPGDRVYPAYSIYATGRESFQTYRKVSHRQILRSLALGYVKTGLLSFDRKTNTLISNNPGAEYSKHGYLGVSVPGVSGYRSIRIYTLL
jgi:hypothetical protein